MLVSDLPSNETINSKHIYTFTHTDYGYISGVIETSEQHCWDKWCDHGFIQQFACPLSQTRSALIELKLKKHTVSLPSQFSYHFKT